MGLVMVGCNSSGGETSDESLGVAAASDNYGSYFYYDEQQQQALSVLVTRTGVMQVAFASQQGSVVIDELLGFAVIDNQQASVNKTLTLRLDDSSAVQGQFSLSYWGQNTGDFIPFEFSIEEYELSLSGLMVFGKPENAVASISSLNQDFIAQDIGYSYQYLGDGKISYVDQNGCDVVATVADAGLGNEQQTSYDFKVIESGCSYNSDSSGLVIYWETPMGRILAIHGHLEQGSSQFYGLTLP
jgi:hypothetical protein